MREMIFLVGPRACGKTTVGKLLAKRLGLEYCDTDLYLAEQTGRTVADIVEREGWDGFRRRESEVLREVARPGRVIATGGGIVLAAANREFMRQSGSVVYLHAPCEILAERLSKNPENAQRPSLTGKSVLEEIGEVLRERGPLYKDACHFHVAADRDLQVILHELESLDKETDK
jgi:Shikimate kinase